MYPKCIRNVIDCFKNLPGIGEKTAERLAFSLIGFSKENLTSFSAAITVLGIKLLLVKFVVILLILIFVIFVLIKKEIVI